MQRILLMAIMLLPGVVGAAGDFHVSKLQTRNEAVAAQSPVFPEAEGPGPAHSRRRAGRVRLQNRPEQWCRQCDRDHAVRILMAGVEVDALGRLGD